VEKLMSNDSTHSSEEAEKESELEVLSICFWFSLEPSIWKINLITDHNQGPNPWNSFNKCLGTWGYTKFCYSHFLDEHIRGHHKTLGTPIDPATAKKNQNLYTFSFIPSLGSHVSVWNMETKRIQKLEGKDVSFLTIILKNKMTMYFCIHSTMLFSIYYFLGW
jgi:alkane 1-monooxygenase